MAKRGGFPGMGMPGNMNNLMKQAQKMQRQMEENQKALEEKEFTATAGGGAVEVTISGKREVTKVKLDEEVVDPDDIEMLEDLIVAATNEALRKVEEESTAVMSKLTGGLGGLGGASGFSYHEYAEGPGRAAYLIHHRSKGKSSLLQKLLYSDRSGTLPDLCKSQERCKHDHGRGEHQRPCCL